MQIAEYIRRTGAAQTMTPGQLETISSCMCEWFPPYTGPGDPQEAAVDWHPDCPVHDEDPMGDPDD